MIYNEWEVTALMGGILFFLVESLGALQGIA